MTEFHDLLKGLNGDARERSISTRKLLHFIDSASDRTQALQVALSLKENGLEAPSYEAFNRLLSRWPDDDAVLFEYLQNLRFFRREGEADEVFRELLHKGVDPNILIKDAIMLLVRASRDRRQLSAELTAAVSAVTATATDDYLKSVPSLLAEKLPQYTNTLNWLREKVLSSVEEVFEYFEQAIANKSAACLVRIGDGEGAIVQSLEVRSPNTASEAHFRYFSRRWFGAHAEEHEGLLHDVAQELVSRVHEVDVVGVPPLAWIEKELRLHNVRTFINCIEAAGGACSRTSSSGLVADVSIAVQMEQQGLVTALLRKAENVSIIGSRSDMPDLLEQAVGVQARKFVQIPPPASDEHGRPGEMERGTHLAHFQSIRNNLKESITPGEVFLVSAGFLGKMYALDIKAAGGIALDIGFLADLWVDAGTRSESATSRSNTLALARKASQLGG